MIMVLLEMLRRSYQQSLQTCLYVDTIYLYMYVIEKWKKVFESWDSFLYSHHSLLFVWIFLQNIDKKFKSTAASCISQQTHSFSSNFQSRKSLND